MRNVIYGWEPEEEEAAIEPLPCIRCGKEIRERYDAEAKRTTWICSDGCAPKYDAPRIGDPLTGCDECGRSYPARGGIPTIRGVYCSRACAGDGWRVDRKRCVGCDDGVGSPAFSGHCSDYCREVAQAGQEVA